MAGYACEPAKPLRPQMIPLVPSTPLTAFWYSTQYPFCISTPVRPSKYWALSGMRGVGLYCASPSSDLNPPMTFPLCAARLLSVLWNHCTAFGLVKSIGLPVPFHQATDNTLVVPPDTTLTK